MVDGLCRSPPAGCEAQMSQSEAAAAPARIRRARHQVGSRSAARGRATAPSVPGGPPSMPPTPPRPADVPPRPAPSATTWTAASRTSFGTCQQACHELIQSRIHGEPGLCERGMDTDCSSAKCGGAILPRMRVACVAVHGSPCGSLRTMLWADSQAVENRPNVDPAATRDRIRSVLSIPGLGSRGGGRVRPPGTLLTSIGPYCHGWQ